MFLKTKIRVQMRKLNISLERYLSWRNAFTRDGNNYIMQNIGFRRNEIAIIL